MNKLIFSLVLVIVGVCCGYIFQQLVNRHIIPLKSGLTLLKKRIQQIAFLFLNPIAIIGATWVARLEDMKLIALPLLCLTALALGGTFAYVLGRVFDMGPRQKGAYIGCGTFTNIGALGALFCYMFLGEAGFALVPIYKLFEEFTYFAYVFPLVKSFSRTASGEETSIVRRLYLVFSDIFVALSIVSIGLGLILNLTNVPRPEIYTTVNAIIIPVIVFLLLFSIGLGMRFSRTMENIYPALAISGVKFLLIPSIIAALGLALGLHHVDEALPFKVIVILSAMPVGFLSVVPPTLYDLDADLANACWLVANCLLILEAPILLYIVTNMHF